MVKKEMWSNAGKSEMKLQSLCTEGKLGWSLFVLKKIIAQNAGDLIGPNPIDKISCIK